MSKRRTDNLRAALKAERDTTRRLRELLEWFWDAVSPEDRIFKHWDEGKRAELCSLLGRSVAAKLAAELDASDE